MITNNSLAGFHPFKIHNFADKRIWFHHRAASLKDFHRSEAKGKIIHLSQNLNFNNTTCSATDGGGLTEPYAARGRIGEALVVSGTLSHKAPKSDGFILKRDSI